MPTWTAEQITSLAPDASSIRAAPRLPSPDVVRFGHESGQDIPLGN